ncbi:MAG: hypothetical protein GF417_13765 [Candidatus Latescibacteria bacterium]|nr:hypothetical protein [bacterium]MBD3425497.1 hypothetical protein [Candidatus Latescibacterota bacterium]
MKRVIALLIILLPGMAAAPLKAQDGSRGGSFLPLGWDAEGEGMGGAATLLVKSDASGYWNPANLCLLKGRQITLGSTKPVPGMPAYYSILSAGTALMDRRAGIDGPSPFRRLGAAVTVSHLNLELAGGSAWNESTIGVAGAISINHITSFGLSLKFLKGWNDLEDADSWGTSADIGLTVRLREDTWFGLTGKNLYSAIYYPDRDEEISPSWNIALSQENILARLDIEGDAVFTEGEMNRVLLGGRVRVYRDLFGVVAGLDRRLTNGARNIMHFGFLSSYKSANIAISFRLDPEEAFDRQTYISIGYGI